MQLPSITREHYGHRDVSRVGEVEGLSVRAGQLSVRSFNFGQHWRTPGIRDVLYTLAVPVVFVVDVLKRELPEYIEDCIEFPDDTDPFEVILRQRHWPDAEQILGDPELCAEAIKWVAHDCLLEWFGDGEPAESPGYVINTVEFSERIGDAVQFGGNARAAGQPVQYQDV